MAKKRRNKLLDNKILWLVVSLVASLLIWMYLTGTQQEEIVVDLSGVEVVFEGEDSLRDTRGYVIANVDSYRVDVTVRGSRLNIGTLSSSDVQAVIDVSGITKTGFNSRTFTLRYQDGVDASAVSLVRSEPSIIGFDVTRMTTKAVPVECVFSGNAAEGYIYDGIECEPTSVRISGTESALENVASAYVEIAYEGMDSSRTVDVPYTLRDSEGNEVSMEGLELETDTVSVTVNINMTKEVPLTVSANYGAGATEDNTRITVNPESIMISGDSSVVDAINSISIATIDTTSFSASVTDEYDIILPDGVTNLTGTTSADVTVEVLGLETRSFTVNNISYTGLPEGYTAEVITQSLPVTLRGSAADLDAIRAENLTAVADLSEVSHTGDMTVTVRIRVDGFPNTGAIGSYQIAISVSRGG